MYTESILDAVVPPLTKASSHPPLSRTFEHFYLIYAVIPPASTFLRRGFGSTRVGVITPCSPVVEVQVILFLVTIVQTIVIPCNPVKVLRIFTKSTVKLRVHVRVMVLFAPPLKVGRTSDLKLLVG